MQNKGGQNLPFFKPSHASTFGWGGEWEMQSYLGMNLVFNGDRVNVLYFCS